MKEILIIGGGIAGCALALQLSKKDVRVRILDRGDNHSSKVASGMVNPMVFRRMNLSWRVDDLLPYAKNFYKEMEHTLCAKFYNDLRIRRFFSSEQERGFWEQKQHLPEYQKYLTVHSNFDEQIPLARNEFGSGIVKTAFWIDPEIFMSKFHDYFLSNGVLEYGLFEDEKLHAVSATYDSKKYDAVVFCCGADNDKIPYFREANIQHNRGQMLTISSMQLPKDELWNRKGFVLPLGGSRFKLGATYEWNEPNLQTTNDAKERLINTLEAMADVQFEVKDHHVGIRPTVADRRPVMGRHPEYNGLFVFNGLGTKGYMLAPLLSLEMADYMLEERPLDEAVLFTRLLK